jgi:methylmalonyl-CoA mutase N-terminal domain/subunit
MSPSRAHFLAGIAATVRAYHAHAREQATLAREIQQLQQAARMLKIDKPGRAPAAEAALDLAGKRKSRMDRDALHLLQEWPDLAQPSLPRYEDHGEILRWLMLENLPGRFPYTAGIAAPPSGDSPPQAEPTGDPIAQLAHALADLFTAVEACLARGVRIDDCLPQASLFLAGGVEPECAVLGRVARRVWAVAMRRKYGAEEGSQQLRCHLQSMRVAVDLGSVRIEELTTKVEDAVLAEFDRMAGRGEHARHVLPA